MHAYFSLNVSDVAAHHAFWAGALGGVAESREAFAFPMATILLTSQKPLGGTRGTPVNHIAFGVPDIRAAVERTRSAGYPFVTRDELPDRFEVKDDLGFIPQLNTSVAFTLGPDDIKVEFLEVPSTAEPIAFHHIHFFSPAPEKMKLWYADFFKVQPADRGPFQAIDLPGGFNLTFSPSGAVVPTKGRVLDRIRFESKGHDAGSGPGPVGGLQTDPWGTSIELSETR